MDDFFNFLGVFFLFLLGFLFIIMLTELASTYSLPEDKWECTMLNRGECVQYEKKDVK